MESSVYRNISLSLRNIAFISSPVNSDNSVILVAGLLKVQVSVKKLERENEVDTTDMDTSNESVASLTNY